MADKDYLKLAIKYFQKAYEFQMARDFKSAEKYYIKSIDVYPTAEAHTFLGWTYSFQGKLDEAIAQCKKAIDIDPEFGNPYNDIGVYLIELGRHDEAVPWLEKAILAKRYEPRHYAHYNLGRVYISKGMINKALEELHSSLELCPDYPLAQQAIKKIKLSLN